MVLPANPTGAQDSAALEVEPSSPGFAIRLPTAQLADLIQINCLNRVRGAFRVCSGVDEGYLFFAGGQLVHAELDGALGLDAVVMMLGLRGGSIEPCERPWPALSTIDMGADELLLNAAQRLDEHGERRSEPGRELTTKVVRRAQFEPGLEPELGEADFAAPELMEPELGAPDFAVPVFIEPELGAPELVEAERAAPEPSAPEPSAPERSVPEPSAPLSAPPLDSPGLQRLALAQVAADGTIQKLRGAAGRELADTAFYSQQVAELIGDALGLGPCQALSFEGREEGIVIFRGRHITGVRGSNPDLVFVRAKLGLP